MCTPHVDARVHVQNDLASYKEEGRININFKPYINRHELRWAAVSKTKTTRPHQPTEPNQNLIHWCTYLEMKTGTKQVHVQNDLASYKEEGNSTRSRRIFI
jgi:hypothetical protein